MKLPRLFARSGGNDGPLAKPPTGPPRGSSGRWHYDGFLQLEELNAELQHPQGHRVYDRMWRTDADVKRSMGMFLNPILGATWTIEPYGGQDATQADHDCADFVRWVLFEHMRPGLLGHLAEALPVVARSGFAPFEEVGWGPVTYNGRLQIAPRHLGLRIPRSIVRFFQDDYEQLTGLEQQTSRGELVTLDARELVYYRVGAEGDNWEGVSVLRPVYKHWFLKDGIERIDAIAQELEGTGLPIVFPPESPDTTALDELEEKLQQIRAGETAYLIMPGPRAQDLGPDGGQRGWHFEIQGRGGGQSGGSGRDASKSLQYHSDKIAAGMIAEFMRLGQGAGSKGALATASVQQDPFLMAVEGFASSVVEATLNTGGSGPIGLVERLAMLNFNVDGPPKLSMSLVDSTSLTELKDFVGGLVQTGAMQADEPLEDYLRERADLPPADPAARAQRKAQQTAMDQAALEQAKNPPPPVDGGDASDGSASTARRFARQARSLRHWEQHMSLDSIEQAIDGARASFEQAGADAARDVAGQVAATVMKGKDPKVNPQPLADALTQVLDGLYQHGRQTVREELQRQAESTMSTVSTMARGDGRDRSLTRRALVAAKAILAAIVRAAHAADLQGHDHATVQTAAERAAGAALRAEAQQHAAAALNEGRSDQADDMADMIRGSRYTSILDGNRCDHCAQADDDVLRPLTDPVRLAHRPPNPACEGGDRCRCLEFYELRDETPASA